MTIETGARAGNGETAAAFVQGTTWGTAVAVGAGRGIYLTSEGVAGGRVALPRLPVGSVWREPVDRGAQEHRGDINFDLFYGGNCGELLAYLFGTSGAPTQTPPSTGTSYLHACTLADSIAKFATLCIGKIGGAKWHEFPSFKASRLLLRGSGNGRVTGTIDVLPSHLDEDSSTNATTQTDAVTVPALQGAARFKHSLFRINGQADGALDSGDVKGIAGFELELSRPLAVDHLADGNDFIAEPFEDEQQGEMMVRLAVDLRSFDTAEWRTAYEAGTEYKWDLQILGTGLDGGSGADPYYLFECPRATVMAMPQANIAGRGRITHRVEFVGHVASAAPTGMSGITQPLNLKVMDTDSSAYLA